MNTGVVRKFTEFMLENGNTRGGGGFLSRQEVFRSVVKLHLHERESAFQPIAMIARSK